MSSVSSQLQRQCHTSCDIPIVFKCENCFVFAEGIVKKIKLAYFLRRAVVFSQTQLILCFIILFKHLIYRFICDRIWQQESKAGSSIIVEEFHSCDIYRLQAATSR